MKHDSLKSAQQHHNSNKQSDHHTNVVTQQGVIGGVGGGGGGHLHHPSVQNDLKLGLSGMGVGGHLGMMGQLDNKTNQDLLKAVTKVNS